MSTRQALLRSGLAVGIILSACPMLAGRAGADFGVAETYPREGTNQTQLAIRTPFDCSTGSTHAQVWLTGPGFPADPGVDVSGTVALSALPPTAAAGESVPLTASLQAFAEAQEPVAPLTGIHRFVTLCQNSTGSATYDTFRSVINFGSPTSYAGVELPYAAAVRITGASPAGPQPVASTVTFEGTVVPAEAEGSVELFDGTSSLGSTSVVAGTFALTTMKLIRAGNRTVKPVFTPAHDAYSAIKSITYPFTITEPADSPPDEQVLVAEVPPGTIIIDTPYTAANPLDLGVLALNSDGTAFSATAEFSGISISDSRAGDLPWTASAVAGTFTNGTGGAINGQNVGLTAMTARYTAGNGLSSSNPVTVTDRPAADPPVAPDDNGSLGLGGTPHTFAHADNGAGSVTINGMLTLRAPSSTPAGVYSGVVTFTVIGN